LSKTDTGPALAALLLFAIYVTTLAPGVTFWDAGELIAAVHVLGIPHPPGTPLFVLLARAWSDVFGWLPRATGTNLFSAACTAGAGGVLALLFQRTTGARLGAFAAAVCAGAMSTVWLNATETEVYAASLLLASAMLFSAQRAGESGSARWMALTAYLMALAVPLHLSALVAAPAAIALVAQRSPMGAVRAGGIRWRPALVLTGAFLVAAGAGLASWPIAAAGALVMAVAPQPADRRRTLAVAALMLLAFSALAYLPIRAAHHPAINEGDPTTWSALWSVVGRRQYGAHGVWPRQAPLWAQVANLFEYADWQVALGLAPGVAPSWLRTPITVLFAALGIAGSLAHRARDRRSWRALVVLLISASAGLLVYLNFKAGASFGYGVLPAALPHEARDREYFFTLAFWVWGAWAGYGAVTLAPHMARGRAMVGVLVACLPIVLNWRAVDRRRMPGAAVARTSAAALLWSAPPRAVLVTGGDNDSFPLWYLQVVDGVRPDVTVAIAPLLPAEWYRAQLARRHALFDSSGVAAPVHSEDEALSRIAGGVRRVGRPLAVTLPAGPTRRHALGGSWALHGVVFVHDSMHGAVHTAALDPPVDSAVASAFVRRFRWGASDTLSDESIDPAPALFARALACPAFALASEAAGVRADSLASPCKFR
jgi:hypothetical protein